jgi:hypothetical protein
VSVKQNPLSRRGTLPLFVYWWRYSPVIITSTPTAAATAMAAMEAKTIQFTYKDYQGYTRQGAVHIPVGGESSPASVQASADEVKVLLLSLLPRPVLKAPQLGGFELLGAPDSFQSVYSICKDPTRVSEDLVYKLVKLPIHFAVGQRVGWRTLLLPCLACMSVWHSFCCLAWHDSVAALCKVLALLFSFS